MKMRLYSDLHNEFCQFEIPALDGEKDTILLLAGDIGVGKKPTTYVPMVQDAVDRFRAVIYIPGNHEYYGGSFDNAWDKIRNEVGQYPNLHMLDNECVQYDDIVFIGSTLWTDFRNGKPLDMLEAESRMNDYGTIIRTRDGQYVGKLRADQTYYEHRKSKAFIEDELAKAKTEGLRAVVVTHHGPSWLSVSPEFIYDSLNGAYVSDLDEVMIQYEPELWVHGHVHTSHSYEVGRTRVRTNPRGYFIFGKVENDDFDESGLIELSVMETV
jgi:predicted phosphohydrolase